MKDASDKVFKALADSSRRLLLDRLYADNGQTLTELCEDLDMTRQAVTQHLDILEAANLVTTVWRGREKLHYLNPVRSKRFTNAGSGNSKNLD
jgi:DNA-binding transcriptional ArsR family regulator